MHKIDDIELLRFPLAVFVVMEHTLLQYTTDGTPSVPYHFFDAFLRGNSVPVFFFISGYLFFYGTADFNTAIWKSKLRNRIHSLLIPYIIWNTFAIIIVWITLSAGMGQYMANAETFSPTITNLLKCFWMYDGELAGGYTPSTYPINVALWYVRNLILLSLTAPLIHFAIKKGVATTLVLCVAVWILTYDSGLFFFTTGACFSIKRYSIQFNNKHFNIYAVCIYIISGLFLLLELYNKELEYIVKQINILSFIPFVFCFSNQMKQNHTTVLLSSASSLIYFAHQPICGKINKLIIAATHPENQITEFVVNLLAVATTVTVLYYLHKIMYKKFSKTLYIITGKSTNSPSIKL